MALTKVILVKDSTDRDTSGRLLADQEYYVEADSYLTALAAETASFGGVTIPGGATAYDAAAPYCLARTIRTEYISALQRKVFVHFEDPETSFFGADLLSLRAKITEGDETYLEEYTKDESDPPQFVRTTAGEPFDRGPQRLVGVTAYTIQKYVNSATKAAIRAARRTNNDTPLTIKGLSHDIDTLWMQTATFEEVEGSSTIELATLFIKHRPEGWIDRTAMYGYVELADNGERYQITEFDFAGNEVAVTKPWPLDEYGEAFAFSDDEPFEVDFRPYPRASWSGVPLS